MNRLKTLDTVAYIRFASVYRDFKDVREFKEELEQLLSSKSMGGKPAEQAKHRLLRLLSKRDSQRFGQLKTDS